MAETSKILEGVFAVSKPASLSSAQVIRDLQQHFGRSKTFAPLLADMHRRFEIEDRQRGKRRRRDTDSVFKIGHGGTLDPLATGVLIIGIGRGTKHLQNFLGCTKQYDTVVLFGKSTDTYDIMGKIVGEAPFAQITKDQIEEKLPHFRGKIKQVPPVYSALKINGMKAYEYARSGKELPRKLESRDMEVTDCQLVEYLEGGQHEFRWPIEEAAEDEKIAMGKLMKSAEATSELPNTVSPSDQVVASGAAETHSTSQESTTAQSKVGNVAEQAADAPQPSSATTAELATTTEPATASTPSEPTQPASTEVPEHFEPTAPLPATTRTTTKTEPLDSKSNTLPLEVKAALHTHTIPTLATTPSPAPAARITLTVSSGFYVRSFAHDLGIALNSHGIMAELTRSRQGDFVIPSLASQFPDLSPALTYADFEAGEDTWGPLIASTLEKWMVQNPLPGEVDADGNVRPDDRDGGGDRHRNRYQRKHWGRGGGGGWKGKGRGEGGGSSRDERRAG